MTIYDCDLCPSRHQSGLFTDPETKHRRTEIMRLAAASNARMTADIWIHEKATTATSEVVRRIGPVSEFSKRRVIE